MLRCCSNPIKKYAYYALFKGPKLCRSRVRPADASRPLISLVLQHSTKLQSSRLVQTDESPLPTTVKPKPKPPSHKRTTGTDVQQFPRPDRKAHTWSQQLVSSQYLTLYQQPSKEFVLPFRFSAPGRLSVESAIL
jgi:hypothetical protein